MSSNPITYLTNRRRADERRHVARHAALFEILQILRERVPFDVVFDVALLSHHVLAHSIVHRAHRFAFAHDLRRHALPNFALRAAVLDQRLSGPGKHVDKPGRDRESLRIDHCLRLCRFEIADANDPIATNRDVGLSRLGASAVVNRAVFDNGVEICRRGDGDRSWANMVDTIVSNAPNQKSFRFIARSLI